MTVSTHSATGQGGTLETSTAEAHDAADHAAKAAGVVMRELSELPDLAAACDLFATIWQSPPSNPGMTAAILRALTKAGNYASGAYDLVTGELLGACVGFFGPPAHRSLHSHIAGVGPAGLGRSLGFALKVHQRAWCLHRGATEIEWTYDPLIRRNAYFNMVKLGARPAEYLPNFYGDMSDGINGSTDSDRVLIRWDLRSPRVVATSAGRPVPASAAAERERGARVALSAGPEGWPESKSFAMRDLDCPTVLVGVPADIEGMRATDPARAAAWRGALRDALAPLMADGGQVTGFDRDGWYVVTLGNGELGTHELGPREFGTAEEETA
jgi:predicted GNAT superfamily acetyltransferase